jgi:hypothetical protein
MSEQPLCVSTLPLPVGSSGKRSQHDSMVAYDCNMPCGGLPENARRPREGDDLGRSRRPICQDCRRSVLRIKRSHDRFSDRKAERVRRRCSNGLTTPKFVAQAIRKVRTRGK